MSIEWKEITHIEDEWLKEALSLYHICFPDYVREDHSVFYESIMQRENNIPNTFHFLVGIVNNKVVCFSTAHYLSEVNSGYIVYIASHPEARGLGLGKQTLLKMEELLTHDAINAGHSTLTSIFLETEREIDAENEEEYKENVNRLKFFKHLGFTPVEGYSYVQPPLYKGQTPVPLYLAYKPFTDAEEMNFDKIVHEIYMEKYYKLNKIPKDVLEDCMAAKTI